MDDDSTKVKKDLPFIFSILTDFKAPVLIFI